jgi:hypothetical protein
MAKIRVLFGHQIRLNFGDPQPMALGGRLVAVAEIAPDLLTVLLKLCLTFIDVRRMEDLGLKFAPHTSLSAIDDRGSLQYFYTSSENNNIKRVIVGNDSKTLQFDTLATPTPRSAITAVLVKPGKVVLFYQALERVTGKILIVALTLSESGGVWDGKPGRPAPEVTELR